MQYTMNSFLPSDKMTFAGVTGYLASEQASPLTFRIDDAIEHWNRGTEGKPRMRHVDPYMEYAVAFSTVEPRFGVTLRGQIRWFGGDRPLPQLDLQVTSERPRWLTDRIAKRLVGELTRGMIARSQELERGRRRGGLQPVYPQLQTRKVQVPEGNILQSMLQTERPDVSPAATISNG